MKIGYLKIGSWKMSIGGIHYYGDVTWYEDPITRSDYRKERVEKELTRAEAKRLNKKDKQGPGRSRAVTHEPGDETERLETKEKVEEAAKDFAETREINFLVCGNRAVAGPVDGKILYGPDEWKSYYRAFQENPEDELEWDDWRLFRDSLLWADPEDGPYEVMSYLEDLKEEDQDEE